MAASENTPITRDAFARILGGTKVSAAFFLPIERATWVGSRYTLGGKGSIPKGQFTGVRLRAADPSNRDQAREREFQGDLVGLTRSLVEIRKIPALAGTVLSDELVRGVDPAGVPRVRFGLMCPPGGRFTDEAAAAAHCQQQIVRAIHRSGMRMVDATAEFDASRGFTGLEAWASRVRLRPAFNPAYKKWARAAAAVAVVGAALWLIPALGSAAATMLRSAYAACATGCRDLWDFVFPTLDEVNVQASDGDHTDRVHLRWDGVRKATGYKVYRDDAKNPLAIVPGSDATASDDLTAMIDFDDTTAPIGRRCHYTVQATTLFTRGPKGAGDDGHRNLEPPRGVSATDGTSTQFVEVTWQPVEHATHYAVGRDGTIVSPRMTRTSFLDTDAVPGRTYRYQAVALTDVATSRGSAADDGFRAAQPPTGLVASDGTDNRAVNLRWNDAEGADSYQIDRVGRQGAEVFQSRGTSYADTDAVPGEKYQYTVSTVTSRQKSAPSPADEGWRGFEKPVARASEGTFVDRVVVEWMPVPHATSYRVLRDGKPLEATAKAAAGGKMTADDTEAEPGRTYSYSVQPVTEKGEAPASDPERGWRSIAPPSQVGATPGDFTDKVVIRWQPVPASTGYRVFRDDREITRIEGGRVTEFVDTTAAVGQLYKYAVRSECAAGPGPVSQVSAGYRNLDPPEGVTAAAAGPGKATVSWTPVRGATGYQVFRVGKKAAIGFTFAHGDTSFTDVQVPKAGGSFRYIVKAKTDTVTGPPSEQSAAVAVAPDPDRPADVESDPADGAPAPP